MGNSENHQNSDCCRPFVGNGPTTIAAIADKGPSESNRKRPTKAAEEPQLNRCRHQNLQVHVFIGQKHEILKNGKKQARGTSCASNCPITENDSPTVLMAKCPVP